MKMLSKIIFVVLCTAMLSACNSTERQKASQEKMTGSVQEVTGKVTQDKELENEGTKNKLKGNLRNTKEDVVDTVTGN